MKQLSLLGALLLLPVLLWGQQYNNILSYYLNGTPNYGVKIRTNIPFTPSSQMPTISINGFNYNTAEVIDLHIVYYIYSNPSDFNNPQNFHVSNASVSTSGGYTPPVFLGAENGKVVVYINDRQYYQRFAVSAFATGLGEQAAWFQGWTAVDEPLTGTQNHEVPYANRFKGNVWMPGNSLWTAAGNLGLGTISPTERLVVNGSIRAKEIKVETANWPDYVFRPDYKLKSLAATEKFIAEKGHLPDMPTAKEAEENGISLGEMNRKLLEKVEELTLHVIGQQKRIDQQEKIIAVLQQEMITLKK